MEDFCTIYNLYMKSCITFFLIFAIAFILNLDEDRRKFQLQIFRYIHQCIIELRGSARIVDRSNLASISSSNSPTIALKKKYTMIK